MPLSRETLQAACEVKSADLERALVEFAVESKKPIAEVLRGGNGAQGFLREVTKLAPPFESMNVAESFAAQRKIGEMAVARDVHAVFKPIEELSVFKNPSSPALGAALKGALASHDKAKLADLLSRAGIDTIKADNIIDGPAPAIHQQARDRRGRVRRRKSPYRYVIDGVAVERYVGDEQKHVGALKAGFAAACAKLGVSLPAWITRHGVKGSVEDRAEESGDPHITIRNTVQFASAEDADLRFVNTALKNRIDKIKRQLAAKMEGLWKRK